MFLTTPTVKGAGAPRYRVVPAAEGLIVRLPTWSTDAGNLIDGVEPVGKVICVVAAALAVLFSMPSDASADGMRVKHHARKAVGSTSVMRPACPDPYSCSPLYGAYGPYGGAAYWTRYTYEGWYR